jgi:ABC-type nitrate/sulfonate/bicarbonate transport system permease component
MAHVGGNLQVARDPHQMQSYLRRGRVDWVTETSASAMLIQQRADALPLLLTERQLTRHILLPGALPYVIAGLAIGAGRALIGVIIGEIFLDLRGLGGHIQISAAFFDVPSALSGIVVVAAMGTALLGSLQLLERRLSAWKT